MSSLLLYGAVFMFGVVIGQLSVLFLMALFGGGGPSPAEIHPSEPVAPSNLSHLPDIHGEWPPLEPWSDNGQRS